MLGAIIVLVLFIGVLAGVLVWLKKMQKQTTTQAKETGKDASHAKTAQGILPFEAIEDSMIDLGDGEYRMLVEVSSINYYLKTEEEMNIVEMTFRRIITGWEFPFAFYIQTRELDNRSIVEKLAVDVASAKQTFPAMADYADNYLEYIKNINKEIGNSKMKKKYVIIGSDDTSTMENLSKEERADYAFDQLYQRANIVVNSLAGLGLNAHIVNTHDLAEVMFQAINKKSGGVVDGLVEGDFLTSAVEGTTLMSQQEFTNEKLNVLVNEFINKLNVEVVNDRASAPEKKVQALKVVEQASRLRDTMNGVSPIGAAETEPQQVYPTYAAPAARRAPEPVPAQASAEDGSYNQDDDVFTL
jgi:hypothetical protein